MSAESAGGHIWAEDQVSDDLMCTRCTMYAGQYTDQVCPGVPTEWDDQDPAQPVGSDDQRLVHLDLGLRAFSQESVCSKCGLTSFKVTWHPMPIIGNNPSFPCENWINMGLLTGPVGEHLCRVCTCCGYGWPERTFEQ
jgi:ribosomal protein L37E